MIWNHAVHSPRCIKHEIVAIAKRALPHTPTSRLNAQHYSALLAGDSSSFIPLLDLLAVVDLLDDTVNAQPRARSVLLNQSKV